MQLFKCKYSIKHVCKCAGIKVSKYATVWVRGPAQGPEKGGSGQGRLNISPTQSAVDIHNSNFNPTQSAVDIHNSNFNPTKSADDIHNLNFNPT